MSIWSLVWIWNLFPDTCTEIDLANDELLAHVAGYDRLPGYGSGKKSAGTGSAGIWFILTTFMIYLPDLRTVLILDSSRLLLVEDTPRIEGKEPSLRYGVGGGNRTLMGLPPRDFASRLASPRRVNRVARRAQSSVGPQGPTA
jgi:hypothetical protein